jgi:hypothetical protein
MFRSYFVIFAVVTLLFEQAAVNLAFARDRIVEQQHDAQPVSDRYVLTLTSPSL